MRPPVPGLGQIFRYMPGQKNVSGITAIKHSLRDIDSRSCKVRFVINVGDSIDRATVNPHSQPNMRIISQGSAYFQRASHRLLRTAEKKECHPVSSRHSTELSFFFFRSQPPPRSPLFPYTALSSASSAHP